ncbi:ABC transporter G family member 25-like protein [Drosera capensis]
MALVNAESSNADVEDQSVVACLPSLLLSPCYPITLTFIDITYTTKQDTTSTKNLRHLIFPGPTTTSTATTSSRTIINGVTGIAHPGEILAVLGPSGSGKSTLLNALAGRLPAPSLTGSLLFTPQNNDVIHPVQFRTGFVRQDDVLYQHLTVRETLAFAARLRRAPLAAVDAVISDLGLSKCADTSIAAVSGGERRRTSIAQEVIADPAILVLDEPTSGLDSTAAMRIVEVLERIARKGKKTIVMSVHQPSCRVFRVFGSVLVMSEGRGVFYGKGSEAVGYFEGLGLSPAFWINPAEFLLDLANGVYHLDSASEKEKLNMKQTLISSYNNVLVPKVKAPCQNKTSTTTMDMVAVGISRPTRPSVTSRLSIWFSHFVILLQRSLKERRHESFDSLRVLQVLSAATLAGAIWWHSEYLDVQDRLGLLFFISIFWGVFPSFSAVFAFPQDRAIFLKERASGMYSLSPYFMARIVGDLPMELILPVVFLTMIYWMTTLKPDLVAFLLTLIVVLGYVLVAQGLGLAIGAIIMDAKRAATVATVTMLAFVLTGGFYVHQMPRFLAWIKYVSPTYYCYRLLIYVQYGGGKGISSLLGCSNHWGRATMRCKFMEEDVGGQIDAMASVVILVVMFVAYRLLAYFALRSIKNGML